MALALSWTHAAHRYLQDQGLELYGSRVLGIVAVQAQSLIRRIRPAQHLQGPFALLVAVSPVCPYRTTLAPNTQPLSP